MFFSVRLKPCDFALSCCNGDRLLETCALWVKSCQIVFIFPFSQLPSFSFSAQITKYIISHVKTVLEMFQLINQSFNSVYHILQIYWLLSLYFSFQEVMINTSG